MTYLAPVANALGWKLEESAASMMAVADAGIKGSMGGSIRYVVSAISETD